MSCSERRSTKGRFRLVDKKCRYLLVCSKVLFCKLWFVMNTWQLVPHAFLADPELLIFCISEAGEPWPSLPSQHWCRQGRTMENNSVQSVQKTIFMMFTRQGVMRPWGRKNNWILSSSLWYYGTPHSNHLIKSSIRPRKKCLQS